MSQYYPAKPGSIRVDLIHTDPTRPDVARSGFIRIGDAERDQAVSLLSDHFVAGRLTQEEFEERSGLATRARYADDLTPLFDDLPDGQDDPRTWSPGSPAWSPAWSARSRGPRSGPPRFRQGPPPPFFFLAPLLMLGLVTAVVMTAPWLLWILFWVALFGGKWQHHHRYHHPRNHTRAG